MNLIGNGRFRSYAGALLNEIRQNRGGAQIDAPIFAASRDVSCHELTLFNVHTSYGKHSGNQFSVGTFSTWSITGTSIGAFSFFNLSPS
jgi:hypothetical protein